MRLNRILNDLLFTAIHQWLHSFHAVTLTSLPQLQHPALTQSFSHIWSKRLERSSRFSKQKGFYGIKYSIYVFWKFCGKQ